MFLKYLFLIVLFIFNFEIFAQIKNENSIEKNQFEKLEKLEWDEVFFDTCTNDWQTNWKLDGKKATITHSAKGMDFWAGPNRKEDASHAVLWTKKSFCGDIRIDYEYTKLDDALEAVNIIYIQATGSGIEGFEKDIERWADKREVPSMRHYYNHMNLLHISYAAFNIGNKIPGNDYIRARRYMPEKEGLKNTDLSPDYFKTGLFEKNIVYKITIIKTKDDLFMQIANDKKEKICHWKTDNFPPVIEGRVGLRHMWTRTARYKNFRISELN